MGYVSRGEEGWKRAGQGLGKMAPEATMASEAHQGGLSGRGALELKWKSGNAHWRGVSGQGSGQCKGMEGEGMWCEGGEGTHGRGQDCAKQTQSHTLGPSLLVGWPAYHSSILCPSSLPTSVQSLSSLINLNWIKLLPVQKLP